MELDLDAIIEDLKDEIPDDIDISFIRDSLSLTDSSLATLVYEVLVPRMAALKGAGECLFEARRARWF